MDTETRVRMGIKQNAKGTVQLDLTAEAPTVEEAGKLLGDAIKELIARVQENGLSIVSE